MKNNRIIQGTADDILAAMLEYFRKEYGDEFVESLLNEKVFEVKESDDER